MWYRSEFEKKPLVKTDFHQIQNSVGKNCQNSNSTGKLIHFFLEYFSFIFCIFFLNGMNQYIHIVTAWLIETVFFSIKPNYYILAVI